jgi:membrane protein DedA with SNARE-associated domain
MELLSEFLIAHAAHAHWMIFGALMLAGCNVPISEDLMIILSGSIAATLVPENTWKLFVCVFLGCYLSDWVCYWIGRKLGQKLFTWKWFAKTISVKRLDTTRAYYEKYGFWTLLIGRFIPFGVRNCLFLTAGIGRMHFGKFLLSDGIACLLSNSILFSLSFTLSKHLDLVFRGVTAFNLFLFGTFVVTVICFIWYKRCKKPRIDP